MEETDLINEGTEMDAGESEAIKVATKKATEEAQLQTEGVINRLVDAVLGTAPATLNIPSAPADKERYADLVKLAILGIGAYVAYQSFK